MNTHEELLEILGEGELASVSLDFWLNYHEQLPNKGNYLTDEDFAKLLTFQNGWLACKTFYKIRD